MDTKILWKCSSPLKSLGWESNRPTYLSHLHLVLSSCSTYFMVHRSWYDWCLPTLVYQHVVYTWRGTWTLVFSWQVALGMHSKNWRLCTMSSTAVLLMTADWNCRLQRKCYLMHLMGCICTYSSGDTRIEHWLWKAISTSVFRRFWHNTRLICLESPLRLNLTRRFTSTGRAGFQKRSGRRKNSMTCQPKKWRSCGKGLQRGFTNYTNYTNDI